LFSLLAAVSGVHPRAVFPPDGDEGREGLACFFGV